MQYIESAGVNLDIANAYLKKRGIIHKAELETNFTVVSPNLTFLNANQLLQGIQWDEFESFNNVFDKFYEI